MKRGRPKQMEEGVHASVILEKQHVKIIKENGLQVSKFIRYCIDFTVKNAEIPVGELKEEKK